MTGFKASEAVEALDWDFEPYIKNAKGVVPEPTTARINGFFNDIRTLARDVREIQSRANQLRNVEDADDLSEEEMAEMLSSVDEASAAAAEYQQRMMECIAHLCGAEWVETSELTEDGSAKQVLEGGSPSLEQLSQLPYRVLQEFSKWIMGEIRPKTSQNQPAIKRLPQDRRRTGSSRGASSR